MPTQKQRPKPLIVFLLLFLLGHSGGYGIAQEQTNKPAEEPIPSIPTLIQRLESRTFAEREKATDLLIRHGSPTLRPLARNLPNASPEVIYRSRKIIQAISKTGDEATFLRCAGILKLVMFGTYEGNVLFMKTLETDWKKGRTQATAKMLEQSGAVVELESDQAKLGELAGFRAAYLVAVPPTPEIESEKPQKLSQENFSKTIDRILLGSIDANRKLVFGSADQTAGDLEDSGLDQLREQQIWINRQNLINQVNFGGLGNSISFGSNWNGDDRLFSAISGIENLQTVGLTDMEINSYQMRVLKRVSTLKQLKIENCELSDEVLASISELENIAHITISKQVINNRLMAAIGELPVLRTVEIEDCDFDEGQLEEIAGIETVSQIFLTGLTIDSEMMEKLGQLKTLRYLNFKACKFDMDEFQTLKARRPNINIATSARAFLGVRGPVDFGGSAGFECRISEVIMDSAADKAGVKIGDVITKINDQEVSNFDGLILNVSQYDIGDELTIEVKRGEETLELEATLGERDPLIN